MPFLGRETLGMAPAALCVGSAHTQSCAVCDPIARLQSAPQCHCGSCAVGQFTAETQEQGPSATTASQSSLPHRLCRALCGCLPQQPPGKPKVRWQKAHLAMMRGSGQHTLHTADGLYTIILGKVGNNIQVPSKQ